MDFYGAPYPIASNPKGFLYSQKGVRQVKSDLLVLLLTNPGERCLTGDTLIPLANSKIVPIKDLVDKGQFWVYSYDSETDSIVAGSATAHKTILDAELVEVTLDDGGKIRCTPNHKFLLRDGSYKQASELVAGESLMPLYRNFNTSKYERIYQPYLKDYRETHLNLVFEKRLAGTREVVHHKDLNKRNNDPTNLQWMTRKEHKELHEKIKNAFIQKLNDPEFKAKWLEKQKAGLRKYYETHSSPRKGVTLNKETRRKLSENKKNFYKTTKGLENKEHLKELAVKQFENGSLFKGKKHSEETKQKMRGSRPYMTGKNNPAKRPEVRNKLKLEQEKRRLVKNNHKVQSVVKLNYKEDCYDLHVGKYHNFALDTGVFVHNCMLPTFGTPLKTLVFDQNDGAIVAKAQSMIATAIATWEPRITVKSLQVYIPSQTGDFNQDANVLAQGHVLGIKIVFFDPENIQDLQSLTLEIPLAGG